MAQGVTVDFNANLARFTSAIDKATNDLKKFQSNSKRISANISTVFRGLGVSLGAIGFGALASELIDTNRRFEVLKTQLDTVTGSADKAKEAFAQIQKFAADTPFALEEVVTAFQKMSAYGLNPTIKDLESFGNVASAMGKSLDQFIEAVADASTGEFERLKEFGIRARKDGDSIRFTFRGVSQDVKFASTDIVRYLRNIGDVEFAGAMTRQMDTLQGAFSNLGDAVDRFAVAIGESFLNETIKSITQSLTELTNEATDFINAFGEQSDLSSIDAINEKITELEAKFAEFGAKAKDFSIDNLNPIERAYNIVRLKQIATQIGELKAQRDALLNSDITQIGFVQWLEQINVYADELINTDLEGKFKNIGKAAVESEKDLSVMGRALDLIEQQFDDLDQQAARKFAGLDELKESLEEVRDAWDDVLDIYIQQERELDIQWAREQAGDIRTLTEDAKELSDTWKDVSTVLASGFEDAILNGEKFSDIIKELGRDILRLFVRTNVTGQAANFFSDIFSNVGFAASGGPISAGKPYIVGEKGPELIIPGSSGTVIPNNQLGLSGVQQHITINANGADNATVERIKQIAAKMGRDMVYNEIQRNGPMRQAI